MRNKLKLEFGTFRIIDYIYQILNSAERLVGGG